MNLLQRMQKLASDWRGEIDRRKQFLLPLGQDLQACLEALDKEIAYGAFKSDESISSRADLEPEYPTEGEAG